MAKISILGVEISDYDNKDNIAIASAQTWMARIPELFVTERSKQIEIGISEVGMDCRKCVARKLAKTPRIVDGSWFPFIGTAVHDALERGFNERYTMDYKLEERLFVHEYKDLKLTGSCDMMAFTGDAGWSGVVNDWKVVGDSALAEARRGKIKEQYRIQAMLYGYGWEQKGYKVSHVSLTFLPRDAKLEDAVVTMLRYEKEIATEALAALESMIDAAELVGWDKVIEKQPKASFCFSCRRYEQTNHSDVESMI
jgi:hypothetical protein